MRHHPNVVVRQNVCNQSSRHGETPTLIVLHDTEGGNVPKSNRDLQSLAAWFDNPSAQASAHVGVDRDGNSARYVDDDMKAWACTNYNAVTLNIEQIGFATDDWKSKSVDKQLEETARWVAWWSLKHNIPLKHITRPKLGSRGVTQHRALGAYGGGHKDVNEDYPIAEVLRRAKEHRDHLEAT